jgi:hypothetical protein
VRVLNLNYIQSLPSHYEHDPAKRTLRDRFDRSGTGKNSRTNATKLLDFIRSLGNSYAATNQPETKSVASQKRDLSRKCRTTSTLIAGKEKTVGDIVSPIVDERDWECLK